MAKLEKLKAIRKIESDLSKETLNGLLSNLDISYENYRRRMKGIDKEEEFLVILKSNNLVKHVTKIDESVTKMFDLDTTDYEVEFYSGKKILVEVKSVSTGKPCRSFTTKYLDNISRLGAKKGLKVIFVVCIYNLWMAFDIDYIKSNHNKITLDDYKSSIMYKVFNLQSYVFLNGIKVKTVYDKNKKTSALGHKLYGGLVSQTLYFRGEKIYKYNNKDNKEYVICLEEIDERLENVRTEYNDNYTIVIRESKVNESVFVVQEIDMILSQIYHTIDGNGNYLKISDEIIYNNSKNAQQHYFPLYLIRKSLEVMKSRGLIFYRIVDSKIIE